METKSEVILKIRKLLALSKSSNRHEAELAAQRASELMAKYQIEASAMEVSEVQSGHDAITREDFTVPGLKMKYQWVVILGYGVAKLFDGTILTSRRLWGTSFVFIGFKSEIPLMKELFLHLYRSWEGFVEADLDRAKADRLDSIYGAMGWEPRDTMKFKHGHGQGYADAIFYRCVELAKERAAHLQASGNSCTALVVVRTGALSTYLKAQHIGKGRALRETAGSNDGRAAGHRAGSRVALGGAIGSGASAQLRA